jgi:hypothetical protein
MSLVVKTRLHPMECDREHSLEIELWDGDGGRVGPRIEQRFRRQRNPEAPADDVFVQLVVNLAGLRFPAPGPYAFQIMLDGQVRKTLPLRLVDAAATAAKGPA